MTITAAICTRGRPELLRRAAESLRRQSAVPFEILVVDNAPVDDLTRTLVSTLPDLRYVTEPLAGLDFARNRALREARGEVVAFLDDDAVADARWAESLARCFDAHPEAAVVTGRTEALSLAEPGQRIFEANGGFGRGLAPITLPDDAAAPLHGRSAPLIAWAVSVGSGANFAVRRAVALELGGFDESLDRGPSLPGGGDHDMLWRVLQAGHKVCYEPSALAWHEHRAGLDEAYNQIVGHQRGLIAFLVKSVRAARGRTRVSLMTFLAWRLFKPGARILRRIGGRDPLPIGVLFRMWWNCWRGLAA
ncbi:MAG TPA: glycosyltransferase [Gemmatimonadales bacterium]|nr:glycosyltransferase [Gemmatimonadales bacterium]